MTDLPPHFDDAATENLVAAAKNVLKSNMLGACTKPAPSLYPHQWNWDAGFIALGYARSDFRQACSELTALFRGQWANGMAPQIIFSVKNSGKYFPGYFLTHG